MEVALGIDVGGTSIKAGVFSTEGELLAECSVRTPALDNEAAYAVVTEGLTSLLSDNGLAPDDVVALGLDVPAPVDSEGRLGFVPNMTLDGDGLRGAIGLAFPFATIAFVNDANAAALGEMWAGAAAGVRDCVMLALGTGVGAGVIVGGRLVAGAFGAGGEAGHITVNPGETHVLMGHNGAGKSTLMSALMGDPRYNVTRGQIIFRGQDITHETADVRARAGMFLSFQTPEEIPGITLESFLRTAQAAVTGKPVKVMKFRHELAAQMEALNMDPAYADRYLNVGFSGGEKKKAEILQLLMLKPSLALLDETDSGLDVDAVKTVANGIKAYHNDTNALIIITHNAKILEGLQVDYVHVLDDARIVRTGNGELVSEIIEEGFAALKEDEAK